MYTQLQTELTNGQLGLRKSLRINYNEIKLNYGREINLHEA